MEMTVYNLFTMLSAFFVAKHGYARAFTWGGIIVGAVWLTLFLLQAFGLYAMAKNRGAKKRVLAFIPFANTYFIGKMTGDCDVFGRKLKNTWLYVLIGQILTVLLVGGALGAQVFLYVNEGAPVQTELGASYWQAFTHKASIGVYKFYNIVSYILPIIELAYEVFLFILLLGLFKQYNPKNYLVLGFLTLFVPISRYIVIFVLRDRKAIDYEAYMRARREAYMRAQQARYGNPYNNPYGNPYGNPYNNPYNNQNAGERKPPEEPFAEFGSATENAQNQSQTGQAGDNSTGDGFFD